MDCDYTDPGGTPLERIAQQQDGTHPAPCARSCEANAYEIEVRRLSAELERERMRLTACGVVAMADTPESAAQAREMRDEYRSASCDDFARRVDECMTLRAERDALAAELAELEGQYPVFAFRCRGLPDFCTCTEGLYAELAEKPHLFEVRKLYARPVPAEPVNARLLEALKGLMALSDHRVDLRDQAKAARSAIAAAEAQQERLLQDMHDAGREIDRVMAEPQPDAGPTMTRDDVIRLALEAGFIWEPINNIADPLERFAALVADDVRARRQE